MSGAGNSGVNQSQEQIDAEIAALPKYDSLRVQCPHRVRLYECQSCQDRLRKLHDVSNAELVEQLRTSYRLALITAIDNAGNRVNDMVDKVVSAAFQQACGVKFDYGRVEIKEGSMLMRLLTERAKPQIDAFAADTAALVKVRFTHEQMNQITERAQEMLDRYVNDEVYSRVHKTAGDQIDAAMDEITKLINAPRKVDELSNSALAILRAFVGLSGLVGEDPAASAQSKAGAAALIKLLAEQEEDSNGRTATASQVDVTEYVCTILR